MLYLALGSDLRERYRESVWLAYVQQIEETEFRASDTLVVCEWMFTRRDALMQTLSRVRNQGARVVFIGAAVHETEDFKRELCLLGIYDFLFVGSELILQDLDHLLEHARSVEDVEMYLRGEEAGPMEPPKLVDVFTTKDEPFLWSTLEDGSAKTGLSRFDALLDSPETQGPEQPVRPAHKFVWPDPAPVRVRILGERGCGKSFVALQIAALCQQHELSTAIIEDDLTTLSRWCDTSWLPHLYSTEPPQGYRLILDTRSDASTQLSDVDLLLWVMWPDWTRMAETVRAWPSEPEVQSRLICLVNHHTPGVLRQNLVDVETMYIPHEPRQFHAIRMKTPLVRLDVRFAKWMMPVVDRISACFVDPNRRGAEGGTLDAVAAGT